MSSQPLTTYSPSVHSRPWTGHTRPPTGRPQTSASTLRREGSSYVVAIVEGRGVSREVGIAAVDRDTGHVMLVQVRRICSTILCRTESSILRQIADCQTYVKSLHQLHLHNPFLVLVPETFLSSSDAALAPAGKRSPSTSLLVQYILEEFPGVQIEPVARRYWNDSAGNSHTVFSNTLISNIVRPRVCHAIMPPGRRTSGNNFSRLKQVNICAIFSLGLYERLLSQILLSFCSLCSFQIRRSSSRHSFCDWISPNQIRCCGWYYVNRSRHHPESRACQQHSK